MNYFGVLKKHKLKIIFLEGAIVGGIIFLLLFGVHILNGTYIDRLLVREGVEDLPQHYLAWEFFRRSAWSFPLGNIQNLIYPDSISIVYTDSIPLFAVFFKLFSPILPTYFQYFGIWTFLCFMLQGAFAALLSYRFNKSNILSLLFSVFFVLSTIVLKRTFYHSALSAHWLILAAFAIWLYKNQFKSKKQVIILYTILNMITVTIEAYFIPIIIGIMFCCLLQDVIDTKKWKLTFATIGSSFTGILLTAWIFGYFSSNISPSTIGLGEYSFNLNGLFNTGGFSAIFKASKLYLSGQNEGLAYLGLGIFILFGLSILYFIYRLFKYKHNFLNKMIHSIPWIILIVVFTILALSPDITFGDKLLISINWPKPVYNMLSIFRSSGRFIWPVFYAIILFCIYELSLFYNNLLALFVKKRELKFITSSLMIIIVCIVLWVQLYDISPYLDKKHELISEEVVYSSPFESEVWNQLAETHKYIYIYSPIRDLYSNYSAQSLSLDLEKFALDHDLILNAAYLSRDISKAKDKDIAEHFSFMEQGEVDNDYIYIFPKEENVPGAGYGLHYYNIDGIVVGVNTPIRELEEIEY